MAKTKMVLINRNEYNRIRKLDHAGMTAYLQKIRQEAFEEGKKSAVTLEKYEIREMIHSVKGIGSQKTDAIMQALIEAMERKRQTEGV